MHTDIATSGLWIYRQQVYVSRRSDTGSDPSNKDRQKETADVEEWIASMHSDSGRARRHYSPNVAQYLSSDWGADRKRRSQRSDAEVGFSHAPASAKLNVLSNRLGEYSVRELGDSKAHVRWLWTALSMKRWVTF